MNSELKNALTAAGQKAQYDASAKRLLGQKAILAHILVKTVEEFKGMDLKETEKYIEGDPYISLAPTEPGLTNKANENQMEDSDKKRAKDKGSRVVGLNAESEELNEGLARFDIIFYVRLPIGSGLSKNESMECKLSGSESVERNLSEGKPDKKGELVQIIMNIEAQKDETSEYDILNRAVFYVCRLISSQKEPDFTNSNYNDLKRVYSIWVCMNTATNSMCHIHLTKDDLIDTYNWKGGLDLLNIVMIGLSEKLPEHDETYELHRLLGTLLSQVLTAQEKMAILEKEYHIPAETHMRKDVSEMCNLGEGIEERGVKKGFERGMEQGLTRGIEQGEAKEKIRTILKMYQNGFTEDQIASVTDKDIKEVRKMNGIFIVSHSFFLCYTTPWRMRRSNESEASARSKTTFDLLFTKE